MVNILERCGYNYLIKTDVTKSVAMSPKQAKTTAAIGSGSPQRTYCTGIGSQPEGNENNEKFKQNFYLSAQKMIKHILACDRLAAY